MEPNVPGDVDTVALGFLEGQLKRAEEACGPGDDNGDEAELPQYLLPVFVGPSCGVGKFVGELSKLYLPMRGQFNGLTECVDEPAKDDLASAPAAFALEQFLERDYFVSLFLQDLWSSENHVNGMK